MRDWLRQNCRFVMIVSLSALALRLLFFLRFPSATADSLIYADIAQNWLHQGIYGITDAGKTLPTCIRLPGYPAVLALLFSVFGVGHYRAVLAFQILADLGTCLLIADLARRVVSSRAAKLAFLLAGLCPFLANYAAAALTETLEVFFTALALDLATIGLEDLRCGRLRTWIACGFAVGGGILLRPDGGLLLMAVGLYLVVVLFRALFWTHYAEERRPPARSVLQAGVVFGFCALAPLIPWTLRNLHTFHQFQPLAPRYANTEQEFVPAGFNRWAKTWMVDYVSVEEIYWAVPGDSMDASKLPSRAFDSEEQRTQTVQLLADYNRVLHMTPTLDARFAALAAQRVHGFPLRYYAELPLLRIADMWLRPRTELLPSDTRWWEFNDDPEWSALAVFLGVLGVFYAGAAVLGLLRVRVTGPIVLLLCFLIMRSAFLGTLENPEPRYTLECYPVVLVLASAIFG